jgi:uncharacterized protein involved in exopolysaccharide biosynthesis
MDSKRKLEEIHLADYFNILIKRKMLVIGCIVFVVAVAAVYSFLQKPVYQAQSRLTIERETISSPITATRTEFADITSQMLTFNTHFRLITSRPVLLKLLEALESESTGVEEVPKASGSDGNMRDAVRQFLRSAVTWIKGTVFGLLGKGEEPEASPEVQLAAKLSSLANKISVNHLRETRLLTISVEDTDPKLAARIANLLASQYIEFDMAIRLDADNRHLEWLTRELYSMGQRLEDDEQKFFEYKQQQGVFSLVGKQKILDQRSTELNNEYLDTKNRRQELDTKIAEIGKKNDVAHIRSILDNPSIDSIYSSLTALELDQARQAKVLKPKHPRMVQLDSEVKKVREKLKSELEKEVENLKVQRIVLYNREKLIEDNIAQFEKDALDASTKELTYTILQRNMDTSQKLYDTLVAKIKETGVVAGAVASNVRVVENATVPLSPIRPNKKRNIVLGFLLGIFSGVGLAFFREYLDLTVRDEEDIARLLELPVLAVVPIAHKAEKGGY